MLVLNGADVSILRRSVVVRSLRKLSISIIVCRLICCFLRLYISLGCETLLKALDTSRSRRLEISVLVVY